MSRVSVGATSLSARWRAMSGLELLLEHGQRRDADQVALAHLAEQLGAQDDVERLIPGHVLHLDRDLALDVVGGDDVHLADVGQQAQDVVDVGAAEVEVDAPPDVALLGPRRAGRQHQAAADDAAAARTAAADRWGSCLPVGVARSPAVPGAARLGRRDRQHRRGGPPADRTGRTPATRPAAGSARTRPAQRARRLQSSSPHRMPSSGSTRIALSTGCGSPLALVSICSITTRSERMRVTRAPAFEM